MRAFVYVAGEESVLAATGTLGHVHRHVCRAQQLIDADTAVGKVSDADTGTKGHLGTVDPVPYRDQLDQLIRYPCGIIRAIEGIPQRRELVAAHARAAVGGTPAC